MNSTNPINTRYKTQMCRHWEQTYFLENLKAGNCQLGPKCHFAHGKEELRLPSDPLPMNQNGWQATPTMQKSYPRPIMAYNNFSNNTPQLSNYKTIMCKYFEQGFCKYNEKCNFAHGPEELQDTFTVKPKSMPPRSGGGGMGGGMSRGVGGGISNGMNPSFNRETMVSNQGGSYPKKSSPTTQQKGPTTTLSPSSDSSITAQIAQTQINYLIQQLETHHKTHPKFYNDIQSAKELLESGNIQATAEILNEIMQRTDRSPEDAEKYNSYVVNIQQLGTTLYTQYQTQMQKKQQQQQLEQTQQYSSPTMPTMKGSYPGTMEGGSPMQQSPSPTYNTQTMQSGGIPQAKYETNTNGYYPNPNSQFSTFQGRQKF